MARYFLHRYHSAQKAFNVSTFPICFNQIRDFTSGVKPSSVHEQILETLMHSHHKHPSVPSTSETLSEKSLDDQSVEGDGCNLLIQSQKGSVEEAIDLLSKLKDKDCEIRPSLSTWNSSFLYATRAGRTDVFWSLYELMLESDVAPDTRTLEHVIVAFCIDDQVERGYELLRQVLSDGIIPHNSVFNKLVAGFSKMGDFGRVSEILHIMIDRKRTPDIFTYQQVLNGLCKKKRKVYEGYRVFNSLKIRGYKLNVVMYTTMICGLCKIRKIEEAKKLWAEMTQTGLNPNEYTYSTLIHGLYLAGELEEAGKMLDEMINRGFVETTETYNTLIHGMCVNGKMEEACSLMREMSKKGVACDLITYNALIRGFCKVGDVGKGEEFFEKALEEDLQPSISSYTPLIRGYCEMGRMEKAVEYWKDMERRGVEPRRYNFEHVIGGFCRQGLAVEGMLWLIESLKEKLIPNQRTFELLIQCLSQDDKLDEALLVLDSMFYAGHTIEENVCRTLVGRLVLDNLSHVDTSLRKILDNR